MIKTSGVYPIFVLALMFSPASLAQFGPPPGPPFNSPEVAADGRITFRLYAPNAEAVRLAGTDIPDNMQGAEMKKDDVGVWTVTLGPVAPGAYRYHFDVDGVAVIDPRNPATSEANANTWSLVYVPGAEFMDVRDVPHGAVAEVTYYSTALNRFRRMHVYTPPGYEWGGGRFPVFYLLHGALDCDDSWSTVGRAGFILDNLIADGRARPMVVVMPAGHTGPFAMGDPRPPGDDFVREFMQDIMPYVEGRYRVRAGRNHRAIAGLSMGGGQALNIAVPNLDKFAHIGVYSSGIFRAARAGAGVTATTDPAWEEQHQAVLDDARLKKGLKVFWFATGKDDFVLENTRATVAMFRKHGFDVTYNETAGGHTWINWRHYLRDFAPLLFR
jgi:enterochelin esterase family protein